MLGRQFARRPVDDAERAQGVAVFVDKGSAGVEADVRVGSDEGIVAKALIQTRIGDDEEIGLQNRSRAKSDVAWCF